MRESKKINFAIRKSAELPIRIRSALRTAFISSRLFLGLAYFFGVVRGFGGDARPHISRRPGLGRSELERTCYAARFAFRHIDIDHLAWAAGA